MARGGDVPGPLQIESTCAPAENLDGLPRQRTTGLEPRLPFVAPAGETRSKRCSKEVGKILVTTGQLGEVMKESAQAALTYASAHADEQGIAPDFFE
jgi:ATP-dependent Lon protease